MSLHIVSNKKRVFIILLSIVVLSSIIWRKRQFLFFKENLYSEQDNHITIDANLKKDWNQDPFISSLTSPWKNNRKDRTKFDYKINNGYFYFYFKIIDSTLTITTYVNEKSVIKSDRVELFFLCDNTLSNYYCIEIDP
jgi:hypothetical protein